MSKYTPIASNRTKKLFSDYIEHIDLPEIDYFAIGIQSLISKKSMSLMSNDEWQKEFSYNNYAEHDPLRKTTMQTNRTIIPFSEIDYFDNFGAKIMKERSVLGMKSGIVLMQRYTHHNYMITLGTGYTKFDPYDFLKRYSDDLTFFKQDLIKIINQDAKQFLESEFILNHLFFDAK